MKPSPFAANLLGRVIILRADDRGAINFLAIEYGNQTFFFSLCIIIPQHRMLERADFFSHPTRSCLSLLGTTRAPFEPIFSGDISALLPICHFDGIANSLTYRASVYIGKGVSVGGASRCHDIALGAVVGFRDAIAWPLTRTS